MASPVLLRDITEQDLRAAADLVFYIWHEHYSSFLPKKYADENYPLHTCIEKQKTLLANCRDFPQQHKALVAIDETGRFLGLCYVAQYQRPPSHVAAFDISPCDAELHRLYIWPHAARKGLGLKFLQAFTPWFVQNKFSSCRAWTFDDNPTREFFIKNGAQPVKKTEYIYTGKKLALTALGWDNFPDHFGQTNQNI